MSIELLGQWTGALLVIGVIAAPLLAAGFFGVFVGFLVGEALGRARGCKCSQPQFEEPGIVAEPAPQMMTPASAETVTRAPLPIIDRVEQGREVLNGLQLRRGGVGGRPGDDQDGLPLWRDPRSRV